MKAMKIFGTFMIIIATVAFADGLSCYSCSDNNFDGEARSNENCFNVATSDPQATAKDQNCTNYPGEEYCQSKFTIQDGVVTSVERGCESDESDEDFISDSVPINRCVTDTGAVGNPATRTICYYGCTENNCNTISTLFLKKCSSNCSIDSYQGSCNYLNGACVCSAGYEGEDCSNTVTTGTYIPKKCVQCNTETDSGCRTAKTAVDCPGVEGYCSTATTWVYDSSDNVVKTVTTRGCTRNFFATDECTFTDIYTDSPISDSSLGYEEVTCFSTCSVDGCNTNNANGAVDGDEYIPLYCVQCSGSGSDCAFHTTRTVCPRESKYCKSTVKYFISEADDVTFTGANPSYKLRSVVRECATEAVTAKCTEIDFGTAEIPSNVKSVTCEETCQWDGCNTGWPVRPKCVRCRSDYTNEYDYCIQNPTLPQDCDNPYDKYCYIYDTGIEKGVNSASRGYPRRFERGCSHFDRGTSCASQTPRDTEIETCNRTCTTDGCNVGSGGNMSFQTLTSVFAVATISRVLYSFM